jgi:comEA protein
MKILPFVQSLGFTRNEIKIVLLLSGSFLVGLGLRSCDLPFLSASPPPGEFDYTVADSVFHARSGKSTGTDFAPTRSTRPASAERSKPAPSVRININTAGKSELMKLPGIGAAYADRIIAYRTEHGRFTSVDELLRVKGIGKKKLEKLRPFIAAP